jgi:hypothetical protein
LRPTEFSTENHFTELSENKPTEMEMGLMMSQSIRIPQTNSTVTTKLSNCNDKVSFKSDSTATGLYLDTSPRNSISVICPDDSSKTLMVSFTKFDLEIGDTLVAFDGPTPSSPMLGSGTGVGSFQLGGSMIASSCDKGQNASGCLTFQFKTNGNNQKGTGWDAWVECRGSTTTISAGGNQFYTINCNNLKADVSIKAARINAGCSLPNDSILVEVVNAQGALCKDTCIRADSSFILTNLAIGNYTVRHKVKSMPSLQAQHRVIVSPSALTCNDKVEMALGGGCSAVIRPDHVLENPCDTSENLYYDIAIKTLDGKVIKTGTSRNGAYPMIT